MSSPFNNVHNIPLKMKNAEKTSSRIVKLRAKDSSRSVVLLENVKINSFRKAVTYPQYRFNMYLIE